MIFAKKLEWGRESERLFKILDDYTGSAGSVEEAVSIAAYFKKSLDEFVKPVNNRQREFNECYVTLTRNLLSAINSPPYDTTGLKPVEIAKLKVRMSNRLDRKIGLRAGLNRILEYGKSFYPA